MDNPIPSDHLPQQLDRRAYTGGKAKLVKALLSVALVVLGVAVMNHLITSAPKAKRRAPATAAPLVSVQPLYPSSQTVVVQAMGLVVPAREVSLKARVSGEIVETHPDYIEGGFVRAGEAVFRIDDADYRLDLTRAQSAVTNARYALALEQGHQEVARREWALLNDGLPLSGSEADLALRKPHLEKAMADLAAAEADLRQAGLQLERTAVRSPFNAIVRTRTVTVGSQVAAQGQLADLVATDQYRVRVSVPVDQLAWIHIPRRKEKGASVEVIYHDGARIQGLVDKLLGDLETEGRMARLLVTVDDPLGLKDKDNARPALLLGEFVRVAIQGKKIPSAFRVPRSALRDNGAVWIALPDNTLAIRPIHTLWRDKETVLVTEGLAPGERLITSSLAAPAQGMALSVEGAEKGAGSAKDPGRGGKRQ